MEFPQTTIVFPHLMITFVKDLTLTNPNSEVEDDDPRDTVADVLLRGRVLVADVETLGNLAVESAESPPESVTENADPYTEVGSLETFRKTL